MRALLRKIILWALAGAPATPHDAEGMDRAARDIRAQS
jgi:hypothetical protein